MNQQLVDQLLHKAGARFGAEGTDYSDFTSSKFAELIVRECLEELRYTVLDTQELRRDKSTDYQVGWEDGMFDAGETIKNIFGVEL
jgi:hypothetical protein